MSAVRVCVCISAHRELVRARNPSLGFGEPRDLQSKSSQTAEPRLGPALLLPDIHCFPVAVFPKGYADAAHWKVYIVARGVQPLVICDGTTLSDL